MIAPAVKSFVPPALRAETEMPSSAIYVTAPLAGRLVPASSGITAHAPRFRPGHPVRALTPNAFHARGGDGVDRAVVVRTWSATAQRRIARLGDAPLLYVIDDDVEAGVADPNLPAAYRRKLRALQRNDHADLVARAHKVLVPSRALEAKFARRLGPDRVERIAPSLLSHPSSLRHHDDPVLRVIYPNTRSHLADWASIWPQVRDHLATHPDVELTTFLHREGRLADLANVEHRSSAPWPAFRGVLEEQRFHVALLPGLPTAFNRARSHNKLLECAVWGAVPVVSRHLPYADLVEENGAGIVCDDRPDAWRGALDRLTEGALRRRLAKANVELAVRIGDPSIMRQRWESLLAL